MSERAQTTLALFEDGLQAAIETATTDEDRREALIMLGKVHLQMEPELALQAFQEIAAGMRGRRIARNLGTAVSVLGMLSNGGINNPLTLEYVGALERDNNAREHN